MKDLVTERLRLKDLYPERAEALAKEHKIDVEDLELVKKGVISEKIETVEHERAVISFINMETVDRDNEIIDPDGAILTHYNKVVPYGHDYRGLPMGKSMWIKKATKKGKKGLLAKTIFLERPPINEELYHMFTDDVAGTGPALNSWSIGFIPLKWEEMEQGKSPKEGEASTRPRRKYTKWELLEYSGVMIPSNREALTEMVEKGLIKSEKLKKDIGKVIEIEDDLTKQVCPQCGEKLVEIDGCRWCRNCDPPEVLYGTDFVKEHEKEIAELVTKPEETETHIRIPVRDCKVTATITISEKQGITALYCGKIKKVRTYIFDKRDPFKWTMKRALAWVEEHGKEIKIEVIEAYGKKLTFVVEGDKTLEFIPPKEKAKYDCECIKCGHKLTSDKHCKDLKCPKCGGQMRRLERPGPGQESLDGGVIELVDEIKGATPHVALSLMPEKERWNPNNVPDSKIIEAILGRDPADGEWTDQMNANARKVCAWWDGKGGKIDAFKLKMGRRDPITDKSGPLKYNWRQTASRMAILMGARGGVDIPDEQRKPTYNRIVKVYKMFDKEPPEFKEYTVGELKELFPDEYQAEVKVGLSDEALEYLKNIEEEIAALKEGRVLSEKNRKLVKQCADMLNELYNATEPPKREEIDIDIDLEKTADDKKARVDSTTAKDEKVEVDKEALTLKIASILKDKIDDFIENKIKKLKGKIE